MQVKMKSKFTKTEKLQILNITRQEFMFSEISEKELSNRLNITPREMRTIYQTFLGDTPKNYITKIKMCKAKTLLRISDLSIVEIALILGYENPSHMSAKFKEIYGETPSSYRRMSFLNAS